jgi:hypothetical protein
MKKMKKIIFLSILGWYTLSMYAQVGIGTENPQGIFHIDGAEDNTRTTDDLSVKPSHGSMNMGVGAVPAENSGAQLELSGTQSAFLPNRIGLTSLTDIVTVPNPIAGMLVFNDGTGGLSEQGLYHFDGIRWMRLLESDVTSRIYYRDLWSNADLNSPMGDRGIRPGRHTEAHSQTQHGNVLTWTDPENPAPLATQQSQFIIIPENGSYAFTFRLYMRQNSSGGTTTTAPTGGWESMNAVGRAVGYLYAFNRNSIATTNVDSDDAAEVNIPTFGGFTPRDNLTSYTVTLTIPNARAGDRIYFRWAAPTSTASGSLIANPSSPGEAPNPHRTSVMFWRL